MESAYRQGRIIGALWSVGVAAFFAFGTLLAALAPGAAMMNPAGLAMLQRGLYLLLPLVFVVASYWKRRALADAVKQGFVKDFPSALSYLRIWTITLAGLASLPVLDGGMLFMFGTSLRTSWRFVDLGVFGLAAAAMWFLFVPDWRAWVRVIDDWGFSPR